MSIEIVKFRECKKNTLQGFVAVRLTDVGVEIRDISLHEKNGRHWLQMPSRPYDSTDGSRKYSFIVDWFDPIRKTQFETVVLGLVKEGAYERSS